jgi:hypothetical protein
MTPISAIIFSVFGGLWVVFAILSQRSSDPILCLVPIGIAAVLVFWSVSVAQTRIKWAPNERRRRNKIVIYATAFEGVAVFVGANILNNMGIVDQYLPLLALIVGLHFLPFARYIPDWRYYPISLTLMAIGTAGVVVPSPDVRAWFVGLSSALVLWAASIIALRVRNPPI